RPPKGNGGQAPRTWPWASEFRPPRGGVVGEGWPVDGRSLRSALRTTDRWRSDSALDPGCIGSAQGGIGGPCARGEGWGWPGGTDQLREHRRTLRPTLRRRRGSPELRHDGAIPVAVLGEGGRAAELDVVAPLRWWHCLPGHGPGFLARST